MKNFIIAAIISAFTISVSADTKSPYMGQEMRAIKALSKQEVMDYLNGKGLGYAKAAELNQFPGPSHVLKLSKELKLTPSQFKLTQEIFDKMKMQASLLGKQYIDKEQELDRNFSEGKIKDKLLKKILTEIGKLQTNIRLVHLSAHLKQKALLSEHQIKLYDQLRGYVNSHHDAHKHTH